MNPATGTSASAQSATPGSASSESNSGPGVDDWARLLPLLRELNDLKRIRAPGVQPSLAAFRFREVASALFAAGAQADPEVRRRIAHREVAMGVAATRLGCVSPADLRCGDMPGAAIDDTYRRAVQERRDAVPAVLHDALLASAGESGFDRSVPLLVPDWVERLLDQPRAGATAPGQPRLVLEPVESCAEHCWVTALYAALLAPWFGADVGACFTIALAHHAHNARLPDAGFAGEALIGEYLGGLVDTLRRQVVAEMPGAVRVDVSRWFTEIETIATPLAQSFHVADTIDRVLQMDYFAHCNRFTLDTALVDMELVHSGPVQGFQIRHLQAAGLLNS